MLAPDGSVHVIDTATATESWVADAGAPQNWGGFSGDGSLLVTAGGDGVGHVWDAASGQPVSELRGHEKTYLAADFYGTDQVLTWSDDGTARLWDPRSGEQLQVFDNRAPIWEAHLSPDGTHVLTTGVADGVIRMWDARTGEQLWKVTGLLGTGGIGAGFSPDGKSGRDGLGSRDHLGRGDGRQGLDARFHREATEHRVSHPITTPS